MSDNQTYNVKVIKNKLRDLYYHIQYIGNQPLEVGRLSENQDEFSSELN